MRLTRLAPLLTLVLLGACRDLTVPDRPIAGGLSGTLVLEDGTPASAIDVELLRDGERLDLVATDATGTFQFANLLPGTAELSIAPTGFVEISRVINVIAGSTRTLNPITLFAIQRGGEGDGQIDGKVVVNGGSDVTGAEVEFVIESTGQRVAVAVVGNSGEFSQRLAPNTYTLRANHPFFVSPPARTGIVVTARDVTDRKSVV